LAFCQKGQITSRTETKGNKVSFPNNVTQVILIIVILSRSLLVTLFVKSAKELPGTFHRLEKLLVQISAPAANCLRNPRIACNADLVQQYRWKNLNLNLKSEFGV
jgi:hypothetical protein